MINKGNVFLKRFKKIRRKLSLSKKARFVVATLVLTLGLMVTQLVPLDQRFEMVTFLSILTYGLCLWAIREDVAGIEFLTLFILPTFFTLSLSLFYFLLPVRWLTRLPTALFYAIGIYALLLTENIFNVAVIRSIQLIRPAQSVGFLFTLITVFFLYETVFSFSLPSIWNFLLVFLISFPLFLQVFWMVTLEKGIGKKILTYTFSLSLLQAEVAFILSFWPMAPMIETLFLTTLFYCLGGVVQYHFQERLFRKTVNEFLFVLSFVFLLVLLITKWGG